MRWLKRILLALLGLVLLLVIAMAGVVVTLNTPAGQRFAVRQINHFGGHYIHLGGLAGSFPSDLTVPSLQLIDSKGVWLNAEQIRLTWSPLALLRRHLLIQALTAQTIDIARSPIYPPGKPKEQNSSQFSLPRMRITLSRLEIGALHLPPSLAGQAVTLHVTGHAVLPNLRRANLAFDATSAPDIGSYHLAGTLTPKAVDLTLAIDEQADGLISHLLDPHAKQGLQVTTTLIGPRDQASLHGKVTFGAARLSLAGALNLDEATPSADVNITIPALAPFAALADAPIAGSTTLHLIAARKHPAGALSVSIQDQLDLTQVPKGLDKLLIGRTTINMDADAKGNHIRLQQIRLDSPGFSLSGQGTLHARRVALLIHASLPQVADLLPQWRGALNLQTEINGELDHLRVDAKLGGQINAPDTQSEPFLLILRAKDLPTAPSGTLTGTGMLAGAPLALDAKFAYNPKAASHIELTRAIWKSVTAQADLTLKADARLPIGTGQVSIGTLSDLDSMVGGKLSGAVDAHFAYQQNQRLNLTVTAKNTSYNKLLKGLNATLNASGEQRAINLVGDMQATGLMGDPATLKLAGVLDVPARTLTLDNLDASWRRLTAKLQAPTLIETQPGIAVRHLDLALARARLMVNGSLTPTLDADASITNLDLALLRQVSAKLNAAGIVNLTAKLTGSIKAPQGKLTLRANGLRYLTPMTAPLPAANLAATATLKGQSAYMDLTLAVGNQGKATLRGNAPFAMNKPMDLTLASRAALPLLTPFLGSSSIKATGEITLNAHLTGTPQAPAGLVTLAARNVHSETGAAASLPPASLDARADVQNQAARLHMTLAAGPDVALRADGTAPLSTKRAMDLTVAGRLNLQLLDPVLAANGTLIRGIVTTNARLTGTLAAPRVNGALAMTDGSLLNVTSGLNLTAISADISAADQRLTLRDLSATAGGGKITGHGTVDLSGATMPVDLALNADHATPIASDLLTETLNAALTLQGGLKTGATLAGSVDILKANINIPKSLPPSVANLPIHYPGETAPAKKAAASPLAPINLALKIRARNQIFIRGDGLFAELGGHLGVTGTTKNPLPSGGFSLIRGNFSLAGKTLQFTTGKINFNGDGFIPALDLEATTATNNGGTATLTISGTASKPHISLSSSPPLPSDEILAQLLFAQSSESLSPFQAASLAAALAQISGIGGGFSPLTSARNALGLDQLSIGSDGKGAPSVEAGRYVAPGVYVGASQSTTGQGSKANVEINLYKGLKLQSSTGTDSTGQNSSSVGLSYQFNY